MAQENRLSSREREVLKHLLQGKSNKLIAFSLGISDRTVEFHLKNVYAKYNVSSRVELILKLGNTPGSAIDEILGPSPVVRPAENADDRDWRSSILDWATSSIVARELKMKNLLDPKYLFVGLTAALFAGLLWAAGLFFSGNLPALMEARVPMAIGLPVIGLAIGWIGSRYGVALKKVFFAALSGVALSPFGILPLMMIVVIPIGKLAAQLHWIDPSSISAGLAAVLATTIMTAIWLVVGTALGAGLLFASLQRPARMGTQKPISAQSAHGA
jgi:DNA-binding CsgD family transcriptional regulator